jgi:hypothetical protein
MTMIGAGMVVQACVASLSATTLTNGSYKFESPESAPGGTDGTTTVGSTRESAGRSAGAMAEIPEPESLILLIVGLIGLSRLRGKPIKR